MKYIQLILLFVTFSMAISCNKKQSKNITNTKDYVAYLNLKENNSLDKANSEITFWENKLKSTPNQYPYYLKLASANSQVFSLTGNIEQLKIAEQNLLNANKQTNFNNANYLRSLARNYISQHRFKEALKVALKAEDIGENLQQTRYLLIDIYLELGNLKEVEKYLTKVENLKDFDYLIRISKYNDHIGKLDNAIKHLEAALVIAKSSNKKSLIQWNYTNLADYYGHAGRIKDSYNAYLKALEINPNNSYAKKGIAWIVYSYERNPKEALHILKTVTKENESPDYHLLKAEIADFMGNAIEEKHQIEKYLKKVSNRNYGAMYAKYNVLLYANDVANSAKALAIAQQEVNARPTAQSYDLLAWAHYKNGETVKALDIIENNVLKKTSEPEALLHAAHILKANGKLEKVALLKEELLESIYELGPLSEQEIKNI